MQNDCNGNYMGQNLGMAWNSEGTDDVTGHVRRWASEKKDYKFSTNQCSAVCGHYTQMVWDTSTKVRFLYFSQKNPVMVFT